MVPRYMSLRIESPDVWTVTIKPGEGHRVVRNHPYHFLGFGGANPTGIISGS
jgi:hypothetical protein